MTHETTKIKLLFAAQLDPLRSTVGLLKDNVPAMMGVVVAQLQQGGL